MKNKIQELYKNFFRIIVLIIYLYDICYADEFQECDGMPDESFVASSSDCRIYIYCMGEDSMAGECDEGEYFDAEGLTCDAAENVYCPLNEIDEPTETNIETTQNTEATTITTTAPPPTTTTTIINISETTTAATTTTIIITTTTTEIPQTTSSWESNVPITIPPIVKNICPKSDDPTQIVLLANNESCSDYYVCYHGQAIEMHCSSHLHFNPLTGQCDYPENVHCMHEGSIRQKCLPHVTDFFPHPEKCNYFYYCIRGFLTVQQCPFFYGWDVKMRACVQISKAQCYNLSS